MESSICLPHSDVDLQEFLIAALGVEVFMFIFFLESKVYDLSTAMFFAFALGLLARGKFRWYYGLFFLACLNRETTVLLSAFYAVWFWGRLEIRDYVMGMGVQGIGFVSTRLFLMKLFEGAPGQNFYFWPLRVLSGYWNQPFDTLIILGACALAGYFIGRDWREKPLFLRCALMVMLPILVMLHLCLGMAFEVRVFAEVFPVIVGLISNVLTLDNREPRC